MRKKNTWARGVSIIGCGMTKMGNLATNPDLKGMSERDLLGWAALEACEDAGIEPADIDASAVGQTNVLFMRSLVMGQTLNHVLGSEGKPAFAVVQGCATAVALCDIIGAKIAAGQIDIGLVIAVATPTSKADQGEDYFFHPGKRVETLEWQKYSGNAFDQAYWEHLGSVGSNVSAIAFQMLRYAQKYGLTIEQLDDTLNRITANMREAAINHPKSIHYRDKSFAQIASEEGYESDLAYLRDPNKNTYIGWPLRSLNRPDLTDGAAAMILCATDFARKRKKKPIIEISGIGQGAGIGIPPTSDMRYVTYAEDGAMKQCFEMANLRDPSEFEYMGLHDPLVINHLTDSELVGYIAPGESWKAILAGETKFDGKRPMQTQGGETQFGDSNDAAAIADIIEAVQQMRGECGPRQIPRIPKSSIVVGRGVHSIGMMVLRTIK
jgi:acetyl-CoA C-acetyltransferase